MAKKRRRKVTADEPDLTPMIDVVFLLLIFFMLITEITQADLPPMELPESDVAIPDRFDAERLVVNIVKQDEDDPENRNGIIKIRGRVYPLGGQGQGGANEDLVEVLATWADQDRDEEGLADQPLLIRADRRVEFSFFQRLMTMFVTNERLKIWKVQIAIADEQ